MLTKVSRLPFTLYTEITFQINIKTNLRVFNCSKIAIHTQHRRDFLFRNFTFYVELEESVTIVDFRQLTASFVVLPKNFLGTFQM